MTKCVQKFIAIGNVGSDPKITTFQDGGKKAAFTFAVNETKDHVEWFNMVATGSLALIVEQYVQKGKVLYVEAKQKTREWTDKEGNKKSVKEMLVYQLTML